jgi:hypothetical protein
MVSSVDRCTRGRIDRSSSLLEDHMLWIDPRSRETRQGTTNSTEGLIRFLAWSTSRQMPHWLAAMFLTYISLLREIEIASNHGGRLLVPICSSVSLCALGSFVARTQACDRANNTSNGELGGLPVPMLRSSGSSGGYLFQATWLYRETPLAPRKSAQLSSVLSAQLASALNLSHLTWLRWLKEWMPSSSSFHW